MMKFAGFVAVAIQVLGCGRNDERPERVLNRWLGTDVSRATPTQANELGLKSALEVLLRKHGLDPKTIFGYGTNPLEEWSLQGRKVGGSRESRTLLSLSRTRIPTTGESVERTVLFDENWNILDIVECRSPSLGALEAVFDRTVSARDQPSVMIHLQGRAGANIQAIQVEKHHVVEIEHNGKVQTHKSDKWAPDWALNGLLRISLTNGRLRVNVR